jgi:archaemetzincin
LAGEVKSIYAMDTRVEEAIEPPERKYDRRRGQYPGDALIELLAQHSFEDAYRVVGIVDEDCYAKDLNFIFGEAIPGGKYALVALPRLRQSFYNLPEDKDRFQERVLKEVVHELGHTWGLMHCKDPHCVMHFSNTLQDTDRKGVDLCANCQVKKKLL